jgi:Ribbon-helix-helix protein, copG family
VALKKTSIYLDEELDQALAAKASEEGVTKAEFIRRNLEVVVARPARPRLSVGQVKSRPGWQPHPDGIDGELAELYDARDGARRRTSR